MARVKYPNCEIVWNHFGLKGHNGGHFQTPSSIVLALPDLQLDLVQFLVGHHLHRNRNQGLILRGTSVDL